MTILQFAKMHNVTKNCAKYWIQQIPQELIYKDDRGIVQLTDEAVAKLVELMGKTSKNQEKTTTKTTDNDNVGELTALRAQVRILEQRIESLEADKTYLQEQLSAAAARADFLMIQTLPYFKRRKAMKDYNQRSLLIQHKDLD